MTPRPAWRIRGRNMSRGLNRLGLAAYGCGRQGLQIGAAGSVLAEAGAGGEVEGAVFRRGEICDVSAEDGCGNACRQCHQAGREVLLKKRHDSFSPFTGWLVRYVAAAA